MWIDTDKIRLTKQIVREVRQEPWRNQFLTAQALMLASVAHCYPNGSNKN